MTPPYTAPAKCPVCQTCWKNPSTGRCQYGGPYDGYANLEAYPRKKPQQPLINNSLALEGFIPLRMKWAMKSRNDPQKP